MTLTQHMAELLSVCGHEVESLPSGVDLPPITVARNIKELAAEAFPTDLCQHLGHSPFDLAQLLARTDAPTKEVAVGEASLTLGWERFICAELLFHDPSLSGGGGGGACL